MQIQYFSRKWISYFFIFMLTVLAAGCDSSESDSLNQATLSVVAKAGPIIAIRVDEPAVLDGSRSFTSLSASLSFNWSFSHKPDASNTTLQNASTERPSFIADVKGVYMVQLLVSANGITSQRAIQTVIVTNTSERLTGPFNHVGLSSDCVQCHTLTLPEDVRATPPKSPNHLATSNLCQACHTPQGAAIIPFTDHLEVFGDCSQCHDGEIAVGKSEFHTPTSAECDDCHNTVSFLTLEADGSYDHSGIARECSGCHNGTIAIGKTPTPADTPPGIHPDTNDECVNCHTTVSFLPAFPDHTDPGFVNNCTSCHDGTTAKAEPTGHPVMSVECDSCHSVLTFNMGGVFNHSLLDPTVQPCQTCHNDSNTINARGKASAVPSHPPTTSDCGSCHNTETFFPAFGVDHTGIVSDCGLACHIADGSGTASGMPLTTPFYEHMPTAEDCSVCHTPGTFTTGIFTHGPAYIPAMLCTDCHNDVISVGKLFNHLPTTEECDVCHLTTAFVPATFDHAGIVDNCESCHDGVISSGKASNHLPTVQDCSFCHTTATIGISTTPFKDTSFTHASIVDNCESCHGGNPDYVAVGATGKLPAHIPALGECVICHTDTASSGFASSATFMSDVHIDYSTGCEGCHTSKFLPTTNSNPDIIKAANHLPTAQDCYLCHNISSFLPDIFDHTGISGNCASCHDGSANNVAVGARGKTSTTLHQTTTEDCGTCHNTIDFASAFVDHSAAAVVSRRCDSCHDGGAGGAIGKDPGHLSTTQDCDVCHVAGGTFKPAVFDHTGISNNCASCHNGTDATGLSPGHLPTSGKDCSVCHNTTAFAGATFDHTGIVNDCASCHDGATARGKSPPPNHVPTNGDCSNCHYTTGFLPAVFTHVGIVNNCTSCHGAGFAIGKPVTHLLTNQDCGVCHNTSTFTGAVFDHSGIVDNCASCHDGTTAIGKDAKTDPAHLTTGLDCSACHVTATFVGGTWVHDASAAGQCDTCHRTNGGATPKPTVDHITTTVQCDGCHSTSGWVPSIFSHSPGGNYPGNHRRDPGCIECHGASIDPVFSYPFSTYAPDCAACHANDFEPKDKHIGGEGGTVSLNRDCAGSGCHSVSDKEF